MKYVWFKDIPTLTELYERGYLSPPSEFDVRHFPQTVIGPRQLPAYDKTLNDRMSFVKADITKIQCGAIVNAANGRLLGGGGVDGAIHRAAGRFLLDECRNLGGCETGSAKITSAYELPCRKVIHAVGPIFNPDQEHMSQIQLTSCYTKALELAVDHVCISVAFPAISTGIYGYPSHLAAPAALSAIRRWLEYDSNPENIDMLQRVIIVVYNDDDMIAYRRFLPLFFPPKPPVRKKVIDDPSKTSTVDGIMRIQGRKITFKDPDRPPKDSPSQDPEPKPEYEPKREHEPKRGPEHGQGEKKRKVSDDA